MRFEDFELAEAASFLNSNWPLLNMDTFVKSYEGGGASLPESLAAIREEVLYLRASGLRFDDDLEQRGSTILRKERAKQFQELLLTARGGESLLQAQKVLFFVATAIESIMGSQSVLFDMSGCHIKDPVSNLEFQVAAAQELTALLSTGDSAESRLGRMIMEGLFSGAPARVRIELLKGLHKITAYDGNRGPEILVKMVEYELKLPAQEQNTQFQCALIDSLAFYKSEVSLPLLASLSAKAAPEDTRKQAADLFELLGGSRA